MKNQNNNDYSASLRQFQQEPVNNEYWKNLKTDFHFKTNYVILTGHDIVMHVIQKYNLNEDQNVYTHLSEFSNLLLSQSFVKKQLTEYKTVYAFIASKKRVDRFIKQNINRFIS